MQWATGALDGPDDPLTPFPAPIYMVNSTLETYLQTEPVVEDGAPNPDASGSCITCHSNATDRAGNASNLSFIGGQSVSR